MLDILKQMYMFNFGHLQALPIHGHCNFSTCLYGQFDVSNDGIIVQQFFAEIWV